MRNLTIKRTKSSVACLAKVAIYIEDPTSSEILINNTPCRKIGKIKNGEEKTFQIDEGEAKVFIIADKLSKSFCNDYYQLPTGQEDIFISGKNKFNLANGNAFRFDNNENKEAIANRKRGTRKGILILIIAAILGAIVGYAISSGLLSNKTPDAKAFSSNGMTITLTDEFKETNIGKYTVAYDSKNVAVFALKEAFALVDGFEQYTLEQYADLVIQSNHLDSTEIKTVGELTYFEYSFTNPETNHVYQYYSYVYKADDAFWLVQFAISNESIDELAPKISEWARSVVFSD